MQHKLTNFQNMCEHLYYVLTGIYFAEPALIAKSNIILDVKPWDDETDMKEMENTVRKIETDGLLWGACKFL